jgi:cytochrome P450
MYKQLTDGFPIFVENFQRAVTKMQKGAFGVDIHRLASSIMVDCMSQMLFTERLGTVDNPEIPYLSAFEVVLKHMSIIQVYPPHFFNPTTLYDLFTIHRMSSRYAINQIAARRASPEKYADYDDVCSRIMASGELDDKTAGYELTAAMIASSGNISLTTMWMLYAIVRDERVKQKLVEEIDQTLGNEEYPTYDVLKKMQYLDSCLQECFRMFIPDAIHRKLPKE